MTTTSKSPKKKKNAQETPKWFRVRAYQVGFGDSFLLTFGYDKGNRHVLIDFGTVKLPEEVPKDQLDRIAADIRKECGSAGLLGVVATHRHRDHISGFTPGGDDGSGTIIASLKPKHVLQPWTEDPNAKRDAEGPTAGRGTKAFSETLGLMQSFAARAVAEAADLNKRAWNPVATELGFLGENNLTNKGAVQNLMDMGPKSGNEYLFAGMSTALADDLPGVNLQVLGPPTLEQSSKIKKESMSNKDEFWQLRASGMEFWRLQEATASVARDGGLPLRKIREVKGGIPLSVRWFTRKADEVRSEQLMGIVRVLDKALNNTSLILLFEIGGKRFLFAGDAQLENWEYALSEPNLRKWLHGVDLYKVGHHGSRNATPKSMWNELLNNLEEEKLTSVISTLPGVYGSDEKKTEVPRTTLVSELKKKSTFYTTVGQHELGHDITFKF